MANPLNPKNKSVLASNLLARMLAGFPPDNQTPMPSQTGGMTPWLPPFQMPGAGMDTYRPMPNMTLPPYEQPGGSLPFERYMQPRPATPASRPVVQQQPTPMPQQQSGGQGWGGPEPAPGTIPDPYDPMNDPRYLPEQWRGAFNNWRFLKNGG